MNEAVLGGLIGSILTTVISQLINVWQKKKEHDYDLKKTYFVRKLCIAESAISRRYIWASYLQNFSLIFKEMSKDPALLVNPQKEFMNNYVAGISKILSKLENPSFDTANAVSLFFDLKEFKDPVEARKTFSLIYSIYGQNVRLQVILGNFSSSFDENTKRIIFGEIIECVNSIQREASELSDLSESSFQNTLKAIENIRLEMKKYES